MCVQRLHDLRSQVRIKARVLKDFPPELNPRSGPGDTAVEAGLQDVARNHGQRPPGADENQVSQPACGPHRVDVRSRRQPVVGIGAIDVEEDGTWPDGLLAAHAKTPRFVAGTINPIEAPARCCGGIDQQIAKVAHSGREN
jgi:hypothetical protein